MLLLYFKGIHKMPVQWEKAKPELREKYLEQYYYYRNYSIGPETLRSEQINIDQTLKFILSMNSKNCKRYIKKSSYFCTFFPFIQ